MNTIARMAGYGEHWKQDESEAKKQRGSIDNSRRRGNDSLAKKNRNDTSRHFPLSLIETKNRYLRPGSCTREGDLRRQVRVIVEENYQRAAFYWKKCRDGTNDKDGRQRRRRLGSIILSFSHAHHTYS